MRGVAALAVVVYHAFIFVHGDVTTDQWPILGMGGVDLFFVISGFVMWVASRAPGQTPIAFWKRRIARIVPLYYVLLSVFALLLASRGQFVSVWEFIQTLLFIPYTNSLTGEPGPFLQVGWSLNYEMLFYLIFGAALLLPRSWRLLAVAAALVGLIGLKVLHATGPIMVALTSVKWLEFVAGMLLGLLAERGLPRSSVGGLALMTAGLAMLVLVHLMAPGLPPTLIFGPPAVLIVLGALLAEPVWRLTAVAPLGRLGDISYSLYLSHPIFMELAKAPLQGAPPLLRVALFIGGAILTGILVYAAIEKPTADFFSRRRAAQRAVVVA
ncbi:acyltransferase family protein [Caulobacter sp. DWR3-1-2]|uniref:acyltransferase family protein n=1 Tax=Caulobacter sp. DWR3-1-2 TaxID=2804647 RepID=UPI003CF0D94C